MNPEQKFSSLLNAKNLLKQTINRHPFLFFSLLHVIILLGIFTLFDYRIYTDPGSLERWFALSILNGHQLPYHDLLTEYPPIAILSFVLPALAFKEPFSFSMALAAEILIADLIVVFVLSRCCKRLRLPVLESLVAYTLIILAIGPIITVRHDMIPAMLFILMLYAFIKKKTKTAWMLLGIGAMTKIFPLAIAPLWATIYLRQREYTNLVKGIITASATVLIISLPWLIIDAHGFLSFLSYHADRGLQCESTYATALLVGQLLGLTSVEGIFNFSSWNLSSPLADSLAAVSPYIMIGVLLSAYSLFALAFRKPSETGPNFDENGGFARLLIHGAFLTVLALILTDKVLSPQYLIWLAPLAALFNSRTRYVLWGLFIMAGIITQYIYPYNYGAYASGEAVPVVLEAIRNLILIGMAVIVAVDVASNLRRKFGLSHSTID